MQRFVPGMLVNSVVAWVAGRFDLKFPALEAAWPIVLASLPSFLVLFQHLMEQQRLLANLVTDLVTCKDHKSVGFLGLKSHPKTAYFEKTGQCWLGKAKPKSVFSTKPLQLL